MTDADLKVGAILDDAKYAKGVKVSNAQLAGVNLTPRTFHGDWNYTISADIAAPKNELLMDRT
jgi:hypothetical protein